MTYIDGDTFLTFGHPGMWPPDRAFKTLFLYPRQEKYTRWRWHNLRGFPVPMHVHVYLPTDKGELFEFTFPKARWVPLEAVTNTGRPYTMHRYAFGDLNRDAMLRVALKYDGSWYDVDDLRAFERAMALGWTRVNAHARQWLVCSSGIATMHQAGGAILYSDQDNRVLKPEEIDPGYYMAHCVTRWRMKEKVGL